MGRRIGTGEHTRPRPWVLSVMVDHQWMPFRSPPRFISAQAGMRFADKHWRNAFCRLEHARTKVRWERRRGQWSREDPPAGPDPRTAAIERVAP